MDKRIVILTPVMHSEPKFWKSVVNMMARSWSEGLKIEEIGITERAVVDWARNDLARQALKAKGHLSNEPYTHFLWLDSDHVFNPDLALRLASHDLDMVSALYFNRSEPHLPVVYVKDYSDDAYKHFPLVECPKTLFKVDAVGFGALLMKREVMEQVPEPWFTIDYRAGEDVAFCVKAKQHGVEIWCDGAYTLGHIGHPQIVTEETYVEARDTRPDIFEDKVRVFLGG